jgi:hypothetical protein
LVASVLSLIEQAEEQVRSADDWLICKLVVAALPSSLLRKWSRL